MKRLALTGALVVTLFMPSCTGRPAPTPTPPPPSARPSAAVPSAAPSQAARPAPVQVKNATETYEFVPTSAFVKVNSAGTEAVFWMYDHESNCKNADEPKNVGREFRGVKLSIVSDKPLAPGAQKSDGLWALHRTGNKDYGASFWGADAKVTLDAVSLDDGAKVSGSFEMVDGDAYFKCAHFTATVCREK